MRNPLPCRDADETEEGEDRVTRDVRSDPLFFRACLASGYRG